MDPDNRNLVLDSLTEQGVELPPNPDDGDIDYVVEDDDEEDEDEEDEDEDEEEEEEEEEDEDEEEEDEDINSETTSFQGGFNVDGLLSDNDSKGDETAPLNRGEVDGLFCPICFDSWSSSGDHHVSCLPCGHLYGLSCIKKWLERPGSNKCPQCKKKCRIKDIRQLYASRVVAIDGELQKKVQSLEAKCASLEKQGVEKEAVWKKKEDDLCKRIQFLTNTQQHVFQAFCKRIQFPPPPAPGPTSMFPPPPPPGPTFMFPPPPPPGP